MPTPTVQPKQKRAFPRVSEHLVVPEITRDEMVRGRLVTAPPSDPPHADQHATLTTVIQLNSKPEYQGATDLLTRVSEGSNFATDTSLRKKGIDPKTGERYLEELAFEVVNTQTLKDIEERAAELSERGVRRIFAIFVKDGTVGEWNESAQHFDILGPNDKIKDQALLRPVRVKALLDMAEGEDEIQRALLLKKNKVLEKRLSKERQKAHEQGREEGKKEGREEGKKEGREEGKKEGREEGKKEGLRLARIQDLLDLLKERFGEVPASLDTRIRGLDAEALRRLIKQAWKAERVEELTA